MAILLHPNKIEPKRYRVLDKSLKIQRYFPLSNSGLKEAERLQCKIDECKRAAELKRQLPLTKMFDSDHLIRGLKKRTIVRDDRKTTEVFKLYCNHKTTEVSISAHGFDKAFDKAIEWLYEQNNIRPSLELKMEIKKAKRFYF